ncbi:phosphatidylserine/phosphatidylglycerophosphate/cardiolipin synthase-like enzyme [Clostridium acetobutylicum]|uniref:phospholipase D n=1 Tax=Clostridium acetobutylicum (strain ATCC 824 / DSM 792 / JCM 1419 / IAM 19013 / LMG 5710 / NBRC 13948 / NRRL B-527 / VKM B-1787 / 2291 / W) TaxID=272562 RepID=Q97JC2_CLOAB|nr:MULTISPECIES: phospholipase D family protein [Clostridium]AAK79332.1 Enzyme from phospholipase D family, possible endonuclease nuc [Clostridium acetobutylicum ATCC 824]ADZ20415.1 Enzyme from phospholipase D family, possible endonuclease nuc [Clostridium acetobutylicum EA 2018]AEI31780.1 phospholipase D family endonuclease [Clostridium acetobutylicum DSM 1731]AWV82249.1 phospholipase D family protein [Clostridium acetobutylicum]MBC2393054.1 phospholipase D family protein [Clostridium acetobu
MNRKKLTCIFMGITVFFLGIGIFELIKSTAKANAISNSNMKSGLEYHFSMENQSLDNRLIKVINSADIKLDIAIYDLRKNNIVAAVINAKKRGVAIRIITDSKQAKLGEEDEELRLLKAFDIPIKINTHAGIMHMKITVVDNNTVTTGSYNYTDDATYKNDEVLIIIKNASIAKDWEKEFSTMWEDTSRFTSL